MSVNMSEMERFEKSGKSRELIMQLTEEVSDDAYPRDELRESYTRWANTYDEDVLVTIDCRGPSKLTDYIARIFGDRHGIKICDIGFGTGNVGVELRKRGYYDIDGLDETPAMHDIAKRKGVYNNLILGHLGKKKIEAIPDDTYDLVTGTGCVFENHVNQDAFEELIRMTKAGGKIILSTLESSVRKNFELRQKQLEEVGMWKLVEKQLQPDFYEGETGVVYHFEVLPKIQ